MAKMRVRDAAAYVGLPKSSLDKMRHFSSGPAYFKIGNVVIYDADDLDAWMNASRVVGDNDNAAKRAAA